jgi:hypothetical protein
MLSLAASRSKTPSALPSDPNIRLGLGETAAKRSFFLACGVLANAYFWPLASFRCRAAIRLLCGRSGRWADFMIEENSGDVAFFLWAGHEKEP